MKTPEEIKKGLECCLAQTDGRCEEYVACVCCPYFAENPSVEDTLANIQRLEKANEELVDGLGRLTNVINTLADQIPRWVSVEERLPEDNVNVLVYAIGNNEDDVIAMTSYTHNMHCYGIEGWRSPWQYFFAEHKITHWMPLPETPEEG